MAAVAVLGRAKWDADAVRDDLRDYVVAHLAGPDPSADVLVCSPGHGLPIAG